MYNLERHIRSTKICIISVCCMFFFLREDKINFTFLQTFLGKEYFCFRSDVRKRLYIKNYFHLSWVNLLLRASMQSVKQCVLPRWSAVGIGGIISLVFRTMVPEISCLLITSNALNHNVINIASYSA